MKLDLGRSTKKKSVGFSALAFGTLMVLTGCGGSGSDAQAEEPQTQVFYQMNMHGTGDVPDRQLVIDGSSVAVYSFKCDGDTASLYKDGGWRGSLSVDGNQIIWTESESGTDNVVFAADGSSIQLKNQPWKAMPENEAFDAACS
ncbi:hypothetical protein AOZ07_11525 [Glutamicibacter halophytocola]|uniref:hypothetical protein n=1 Tax=Glutamicibacter halophytocola TaxID=1933880 RepID=UPI0006D4BA0E|nr:hypothetical protein [Glutamicibacter halophytocola]ALG29548.1 hypothetical protein AOZ07_11525 [Glutamicibacter halophytocola]